ncbi:hypothetical protein [Chishuiella changwenlii]|uniref:hypothetical protein n=1 Tax=Chishuiella changwenlii TaxID=1434701 RepID=UPI002FDA614A
MKIKLHFTWSIILILFLSSCATNKTNSDEKDGTSIEKAIKVGSVSEEYQLIKKLCEGCTINAQSLVSKNNKNYDRIDLTKPNGEAISYYFNIDSFFGKW